MTLSMGTRRLSAFHPAWLVVALTFLMSRNLPFIFLIPINTYGDEVAYVDCTLKLGRGHLPKPTDLIEPELIGFLYRTAAPNEIPRQLPDRHWLASYTYEAKHPALFPLLLLPWLKLFAALGCSLTLQIKLLRIVCLLAVAGGIAGGWRFARDARSTTWLTASLLVPLLTQNVFFAVNSDAFSFLFGSWALTLMGRLLVDFENPRLWRHLLSAVFLALGTKATNIIVFLPWALMTLLRYLRKPKWRTIVHSCRWAAGGLALGGLWFVLNWLSFGHPFLFSYPNLAGDTPCPPAGLSLSEVVRFLTAYPLSTLRGTLFLGGGFLDVLPIFWNRLLLSALPLLLLALGGSAMFRTKDGVPEKDADRMLVGSGVLLPFFMLGGFMFVGGIPFYEGRYSLALLLALLGGGVAGWSVLPRRVFPAWLPIVGLLAFNLAYAAKLLGTV